MNLPPFDPIQKLETIHWNCPACGSIRQTLKMPEETQQQTEKRLISDHIQDGCPAYKPFQKLPKR